MNRYETIDRHELAGYGGGIIDAEFSQLMKAARQHRGEASLVGPTSCLGEETNQASPEEKRSKRKWKKSLLSWWKSFKNSDRKSHSGLEQAGTLRDLQITEGIGSNSKVKKQSRQSRSGPISCLFAPKRAIESGIPYSALNLSPDHFRMKAYGPAYSVT